jgi:geranylgeranyl diphosphate synthase, type II
MAGDLDALRAKIEERLQAVLAEQPPVSLYAPMAHLVKAGGKRIRPLLAILSCRAVGGKTSACLDAAAALELLHTFTLVHDDIMDRDDLRRGRPTVHAKWDEATAILAGDGLVTLAYQTMLKTRHPGLTDILNIFTDGLLTLCKGQALDKAFERRKSVPLSGYMDMIRKKTSALIEVSCEIGAVLGNASPGERRALKQFARRLGLAFQVQDDWLDVVAEQNVLGKPTASDVMEKKKTYLTIHFLENASPAQKKFFAKLYGKCPLNKTEITRIRNLFNETKTLDSARAVVMDLIKQSLSSLLLLPKTPYREMLAAYAVEIRDRTY